MTEGQQQQEEQPPKTYFIGVAMSCGGCSGAVERALTKKDIQFKPINLEEKGVNIIESDEYTRDSVIEIIKKTGKQVVTGEEEKEETK